MPTSHATSKAIAIGDSYRDQRLWRDARTAYRQALRLEPSLAGIWVQYGHACKESGDFGEAEKAYRTALDLDPNVADTHLQLGHLLKVVGRREEARKAYHLAQALDPDIPDHDHSFGPAGINGAASRFDDGRSLTARDVEDGVRRILGASFDEAAYRQAKAGAEKHAARFVQILLDGAHLPLARALLRQMAPEGSYHDSIRKPIQEIRLLVAEERLTEAAALFETTQVRIPKPDTLYGLGKLFDEAGLPDTALIALNKSLETAPSDRAAGRAFDIAFTLGDWAQCNRILLLFESGFQAGGVARSRLEVYLRREERARLDEAVMAEARRYSSGDGQLMLLLDLEDLAASRPLQPYRGPPAPVLDIDLARAIPAYSLAGEMPRLAMIADGWFRPGPVIPSPPSRPKARADADIAAAAFAAALTNGRPVVFAAAFRFLATEGRTVSAEQALTLIETALTLLDAAAAAEAGEEFRSAAAAALDGLADRLEPQHSPRFHALLGEAVAVFQGDDILDWATALDPVQLGARLFEASGTGAPSGKRGDHLRRHFVDFHEQRAKHAPLVTAGLSDLELCQKLISVLRHARCDAKPLQLLDDWEAARLSKAAFTLSDRMEVSVLAARECFRERPRWLMGDERSEAEYLAWFVRGPFRRFPPYAHSAAMLDELSRPDGRPNGRLAPALEILISAPVRPGSPLARVSAVLKALLQEAIVEPALCRLLLREFRDGGIDYVQVLRRFVQAIPLQDDRTEIVAHIADVLDRLLRPQEASTPVQAQPVYVVGHVGKSSGLGRNFGMIFEGLKSAGVAAVAIDVDDLSQESFGPLHYAALHGNVRPTIIMATNAQNILTLCSHLHPEVLEKSRLIAFLLWEMSTIPTVQSLGLSMLDEAWVPTEYVRSIYAPFVPTRVVKKALDCPPARPAKPERSEFTVLTAFDFESSIERKNPLAVIQAFQKAFPGDEHVRLIIKVANVKPEHWSNYRGHWEAVVALVEDDSRVTIEAAYLSKADVEALIESADVFVSLHRSEGFGYMVADALLLGTPVIVTDFGGTQDFCTPDTAELVEVEIVAVPAELAYLGADDAHWAEPDVAHAARLMAQVRGDRETALAKAAAGRALLIREYSAVRFAETMRAALQDASPA